MVSNNSSLGQDWNEVTSGLESGARAVGQALGLVSEDLIPGNPSETAEAAEHVRKLGDACERTGSGLQRLDTGDWVGPTADAFRANYLDADTPQWISAADAFSEVGAALADYARVLAAQQQRAASAQQDLDRANAQSRAAAEQHDAQAEAGNPPPQPFSDPAAEDRAQAEHTITAAKQAVAEAGDRAVAAVRAAAGRAPAQPGLIAQLTEQAADGLALNGNAIAGIATGVGSGLAELGGMVWGLAKADFYIAGGALIDPEGAREMTNGVASTVSAAASDPYAAAKTMVGVDTWKNRPMEALGEAAPSAIASAAGGSGAVAKVASGASKLGKAGKAAKATERVSDVGTDVGKATGHTPQAATPPATPQFSRATPWHHGELPAEPPRVPTLDEPETSSVARSVSDEPPLSPHAEQDVAPSSDHEREALDTEPSREDSPGVASRSEAHHGPEPSGHESNHGQLTHERATEPHSDHSTGEHHEHDPTPDHESESKHQPPHEEHPHDDPDAPDEQVHDPGPPGDEPRFDGIPLLDEYQGEHLPGKESFGHPVRYLDEDQRQEFKLHVDDEGLVRDVDGDLFDTTHSKSVQCPEGGRAIFVMDQHGEIFASNDSGVGRFHHSSFLGGQPVAAAGELGVKEGKVQLISNKSGHYQPTKTATYEFIKHLYNNHGAFFDRDNFSMKWAKGSTY